MTKPAKAFQLLVVVGILAMSGLMGATIVGAREGFAAMFAAPACEDACRDAGRSYVGVFLPRAHSSEGGCLCGGGMRTVKRWVDSGTPIGVFGALLEGAGCVALFFWKLRRDAAVVQQSTPVVSSRLD